jgi:hypothetical protein
MSSTLIAPLVSVIVPTMASLERADLLKRAIFSIRASSVHPIRIIVVVNGNRPDQGLCQWLKAQSDIEYVQTEIPSAPNAVLVGRRLVQSEYFSCLDDDDEYLGGATDKKVATLAANPNAGLLASNAYQCAAGIDTLLYEDLASVSLMPLEALMQFGWLTSGNMLYRSSCVSVSYFEDFHPYAEWTWLAFKLMIDKKAVIVLNEPTCRYNNSTVSLSKTNAYYSSYLPLFKRMLECAPPRPIAQMIHRKMGAALHDASVMSLSSGQRFKAWKFHLKSLCMHEGFRYLSYTRHLLK